MECPSPESPLQSYPKRSLKREQVQPEAEPVLAEEDKGYSGFLLCPQSPEWTRSGPATCPQNLPGSEVKGNEEERLGMSTGKCAARSARRWLYPELLDCLVPASMPNYQEARPLQDTFGRMTPVSMERNSNWVADHSAEIPPQTGMPSGNQQSPVSFVTFPQMCEWSITGPFEQLLQTMMSQWLVNELVVCFGVQPQLVNLEEHGKKPEWMLTAKIPVQSFGADIRYKKLI